MCVIPAKAGIHKMELLEYFKSINCLIPAFAGMTGTEALHHDKSRNLPARGQQLYLFEQSKKVKLHPKGQTLSP